MVSICFWQSVNRIFKTTIILYILGGIKFKTTNMNLMSMVTVVSGIVHVIDRQTLGLVSGMENMSGINNTGISGMNMPGTQMPGTNVTGTKMPGMSGTNMPGMSGTNMQGMSGTNMPGMSRTNMQGMSGTNMQRMSGTNMQGMSGTNMPGITMPGMNMAGINMSGTNMTGMSGTNMQGMSGTNMPGMSGTNMPGMSGTMPGITLPGMNMAGMNMSGTNMPGMNMPGMNMPGMNMPGTNMPGMNMPGMNMPGINMPGMNMPGMNMPGMKKWPCKMSDGMMTYFHDGYCERILFDGLITSSNKGLIAACFVIFALLIVYEGMKFARKKLLTYATKKDTATSENQPASLLISVKSVSVWAQMLQGPHALQSLLVIVQTFIGYCLMMIFMIYNAWICLAVILGAGAGYFLFQWRRAPHSDHGGVNNMEGSGSSSF